MSEVEKASRSCVGLKNRPLPTQVFAYNFSRRKRAFLRRFIGEVRVRFVNRVAASAAGSHVAGVGKLTYAGGIGAGCAAGSR